MIELMVYKFGQLVYILFIKTSFKHNMDNKNYCAFRTEENCVISCTKNILVYKHNFEKPTFPTKCPMFSQSENNNNNNKKECVFAQKWICNGIMKTVF